MATVPNPRTWTSSEQVTAAKLNTDIRDSWNFFKARPVCLLGKTANNTITVNTLTAIPWDVELKDSDGGHSNVTNNTRVTAQTAGWYSVRCTALLLRGTFSWVDLTIRKNGTTQQSRSTLIPTVGSGNEILLTTSGYVQLAVTDYIEMTIIMLGGGGDVRAHAIFTSWYTSRLHVEWVSA